MKKAFDVVLKVAIVAMTLLVLLTLIDTIYMIVTC